jgi:hypothetical protein
MACFRPAATNAMTPHLLPLRDRDEGLLVEWLLAERSFITFLDELGAAENLSTLAIRLLGQEAESVPAYAQQLRAAVSEADDGTWATVARAGASGRGSAYALPVRSTWSGDVASLLWVEIHTVLLAWWLTTAWRTRQLAVAASRLYEADQLIASAACVRPLVESAAATWVDGRKVADAWGQIKAGGPPLTDAESFDRWEELLALLEEMTWGAKFDERAPDLAETWGRTNRTNVLGQVDKLAKAVSIDLQSDYQWLCNTVHPSLGNTFAFSANPLRHETGTHFHFAYAGHPSAYPNREEVRRGEGTHGWPG